MTSVPRPWLPLVADLNGHPLDGARGVHDVHAPCAEFEPVPMPAGNGLCSTDGHHLCAGCLHFNREAYDALKETP